MNKKKVLIIALAVCLIAILSMSTLAWFNASDEVKNDFMFDDTDGDGTPDFEVTVSETGGDPVTGGLKFEHVVPGAVLAKDPAVQNTGDYSMYTRLVVTLDNASVWIAASEKYSIADNDHYILDKMVDIHANWIRYERPVYNAADDTLTYVYYHKGIVEPGVKTAPLFTAVTIPTEPQQSDLRFLNDTFAITVKADAIQSDNIIPADATIIGNEAYTAFSIANWKAGQDYPQPVANP